MVNFVATGSIYPRPLFCGWPECHAERQSSEMPLCDRHFEFVGLVWLSRRPINTPDREERRQETARQSELRERRMAEQSVVYYVRIGDHVKIGFTVNLRQRLGSLRVNDDALLATEPGGRQMERQRHLEFAAERVGRREDFNPSRRLLAHIESVREEHGDPVITTWRSGAA